MWLGIKGLSYVHPMARPARTRRNVGHFLKEWRKLRGLSQERLAGRIDTSVGLISQWETGVTKLTEDKLVELAKALQCEPGDILSRDPNSADYQLWRIIVALPADEKERTLRVVEALTGKVA